MTTRAAIYARVSTSDQTCENQLLDLRRYCEAREWQAVEYVDSGISGAKDRRPALDRLMSDAKDARWMLSFAGNWIGSAGASLT